MRRASTALYSLLGISPRDVSEAREEAARNTRSLLDPVIQRAFMSGQPASLAAEPLGSFLIDAFREWLDEEPSSGKVTWMFACAVLSLIGQSEILTEESRAIVHKLCRTVERRPFPTLFWAEFVESRLDDPRLLRYVLASCQRSKSELDGNIRSVTRRHLDKILLTTAVRQVMVYGYSETSASMLSVLCGQQDGVATVRQLLLVPSSRDPSGGLLKTCLGREGIDIPMAILDLTEALATIRRHGCDLVVMGCKTIGRTEEGKPEIVASAGAGDLALAARESRVPLGIVSGAYKIWPAETYEKYRVGIDRDASAVTSGSSIVPSNLVDWILTEHGMFEPERFSKVYGLLFGYKGLPLGSLVTTVDFENGDYKSWERQARRILEAFNKELQADPVERIVQRFDELLCLVRPGEQISIVCGEASRKFYERVESHLRDVRSDFGVSARIVAGPLLSVDDEGNSPLLRLGSSGIVELYVSSFRQRRHYQVFGGSAVLVENYHSPMQDERRVVESLDSFIAARYTVDFASIVETLCSRWTPEQKNGFVKLRDRDFAEMEWTQEYDFLDGRQISERMQIRES